MVPRHLHDGVLDLGSHTILEERFLSRDFLQRGLASGLIELLEPIETIPAIAHQLAGLRDIPELLGQFQNTHLRLDYLLLGRHRPHFFR